MVNIISKDQNKTYLKVAKLLSPVGLKGEVRVYTTSSFKSIRYKKNNKLYIEIDNDSLAEVTISSFRNKEGNIDILSFNEITSIDEINKYLNLELLAIKNENILDENEYYISDLINSIVFDEENNSIGKIIDVIEINSSSSFIIKLNNSDKTINIPFNDYFVKDVDIENKKIIIHLIEGLLEI